jgi:hypothetical protein
MCFYSEIFSAFHTINCVLHVNIIGCGCRGAWEGGVLQHFVCYFSFLSACLNIRSVPQEHTCTVLISVNMISVIARQDSSVCRTCFLIYIFKQVIICLQMANCSARFASLPDNVESQRQNVHLSIYIVYG